MKFQYAVRYRRNEARDRIYRMTVVAVSPDEARSMVKVRDPQFSHTTSTPRKGKAVVGT